MSLQKKIGDFFREFFWTGLHLFDPAPNPRMKYLVALSLMAALSVYMFLSDIPEPHDPDKPHPTICIFKIVTHIPCPGCGATRGLKYLYHGMPYESLMMNPLALLTAIYMAVSTVWILTDLITGRLSYLKLYEYKPGKAMWIVITILLTANWIWNIYKGV